MLRTAPRASLVKDPMIKTLTTLGDVGPKSSVGVNRLPQTHVVMLQGYEKEDIIYPSKDMLAMPLYIKDPEVDKLAAELVGLTKTSKVDAVKAALKREIASRRSSLPIRDRLAKSLAMARAAGPYAPGDHKRETDEMWGED